MITPENIKIKIHTKIIELIKQKKIIQYPNNCQKICNTKYDRAVLVVFSSRIFGSDEIKGGYKP
eukprot:UN21722